VIRRTLLVLLLCALSLSSFAQSSHGSYRISGKVVNAITGEPLAGARLELAPTAGAQWVKAFLTQKDGHFAFERLAPGKYQLYGERFGYARQGFDEHPGFLSAIVIGDGIDSGSLVFRLQPGATIAGVVLDEYNEAVRGAQVMLFHRTVQGGKLGTYMAGQAQSDDRGMYKFSPLMAGTYFVVVSARPWYAQNALQMGKRDDTLNLAFPLTFFSDTADASDASAINLRTGEAFHADFNLRALPAGHIRVPVSKGQEHEMPSVMLTQKIFDEFDMPSQSMQQMSSNEAHVISGFAPGRYLVKVQKPGTREAERSQMMELSGDTTLDLDTITGAAAASISGLAHAEGVTLENAFIQFRHRENNEVQGDRIGEDGKFKIDTLPAGTYEVSVANSDSVYLANMAASNAKVSGRTLEIPAGADVRVAIILAKGVGEITGAAILNEKGFSGVLVLLVPDDPRNHQALFRRDQSDSDGTFSLKQVVPGRYTLLAIQDGWELEWTDPKILKPFLSKGYSLQVEPNGKYDIKVAVQSAK
jgi:5-hydroxyisourate hydrolase-like protein (transthyretin family)